MVNTLKRKAAHASKQAGLLAGGLLAVGTGLAFLSWAAWFYLSLLTDPLTASVMVGAAYVGLGLLLIGIAMMRQQDRSDDSASAEKVEASQPSASQPPLMQAFLFGMEAGLSAHRK